MSSVIWLYICHFLQLHGHVVALLRVLLRLIVYLARTP